MSALTAAVDSHLGLFAGLLGFGFVVGIVGHLLRSRTIVITGILIVGVVSAYWLKDYFRYTL